MGITRTVTVCPEYLFIGRQALCLEMVVRFCLGLPYHKDSFSNYIWKKAILYNKHMKTILVILTLISVLTLSTIACPEQEVVYGRVVATTNTGFIPVNKARIQVTAPGFTTATTLSSPLGYYSITLPACNMYTLTVSHKSVIFIEPIQMIFLPVPDGGTTQIDFIGTLN